MCIVSWSLKPPREERSRAVDFQGYEYVINRRGLDGHTCIFCRCGKSCSYSGSLTTLEDEIGSQKGTCNHLPHDAEAEAEKIVNSIKAKARDSIYHEAIATRLNKGEIAAQLPTLADLKTSLY